nr:calponin homology domain-containing protein DDB_G0272472 isoform X1 [Osmia lignaria]
MVHLSEATADLMDQLMKVDIFHPLEKLQLLKDDKRTFLDPNVIMDERHRTLRENFYVPPAERSILAEAKKLFTEEEARELHIKKQQRFFDRELKKFETELCRSRPKFSKPYSCKKRNLAPSDDENFWGAFRKIRSKTSSVEKSEKNKRCTDSIRKKSTITQIVEDRNQKKTECEVPCIGSIKVTIKDKPNFESQAQRLHILRKYFNALKESAAEEQRIRDVKTKIQQNMISKLTRKYFDIWRTRTKCRKSIELRNPQPKEILEERRIELFINAITERQRELMKNRIPKSRDGKVAIKETNGVRWKKKNMHPKHGIVESPAQNRLNAQKRIIEKQRAKLNEQNRIIEELKLKQMQEEIARASKETVDMAKETLTHLGQRTRRTLIHLMHQSGYRDESLTAPRPPPVPPKFLLRMEARAEDRRKRVKLAEEERRKRVEEQRRKEEATRMKEEQTKRRLQREALAEERRLRKEREEHRLREIERFQKLNDIADEFYRKCLSRRFAIEPLMELVELKRKNMKKAEDHYRERLIRKIFTAWKRETETQYTIKIEIAETVYNKNLIARMFEEWKDVVKETNLKHQVATDFHDMKLSEKYFKLWQVRILELKTEEEEKNEIAYRHNENQLKARYFIVWKKYITIAADIRESEKRKEELRQLVQKVIPDFDPKQRGVALED